MHRPALSCFDLLFCNQYKVFLIEPNMKERDWFTGSLIFTGILFSEIILVPYYELEEIYCRAKNNYKKYNGRK